MEKLIQLSFKRFKATFLRYFLVYILGVLGFLVYVLASLLVGGVVVALLAVVGKLTILAIILGSLLGIAFFAGLIYLGSWIGLSQVFAVMRDDIKEAMQCYRESQKLVLPYIGFAILSALFMIGLFYTNILLFIPAIIWAVWGMFSVFAFIDGKRGGLMPLWYSKAKTAGSFWKILLYVAVMYVAVFILTSLTVQIDNRLAFFNGILWFLFTPFIMGYAYELYRSLPEPKEVKRSVPWIVVSVIGWLLFIGILITAVSAAMKNLPDLIKLGQQIEKQELKKTGSIPNLKEIENTKLN